MNSKCHDCLTDIIAQQIRIQSQLTELFVSLDTLADLINTVVEAKVLMSPIDMLRGKKQ